MKNKVIASLCAATMVVSLFAGCGTSNSDGGSGKDSDAGGTGETSEVTLELETSWTKEKLEAFNEILGEFTEKTGIEVEVIAPGDDYENVMKTRMASGDLPDLWETHGWSTTRYSEYLAPLNDESWVSDIKDTIKTTIMDPDGNIFVAPISIDPASICYNKTIFEEAGVEADKIKTWDDFEAACDKILASGKIPVYVGGKSVNNIANLFEVMAPGFLTNEDVADNQGEALLGGSFDWDKQWTPVAKMISEWQEKGYFNKDILTASDDASIQALANGETGIVVSGNHTISQAQSYNPDVKLGIMAIPTPYEGGKVYISSGEGTCYGMWKDSEHPEECKSLLEFLASDKISERIATINGKVPGMVGSSNDEEYVTAEFNSTVEAHGDNLIFIDYFDRAYLPSGMWNDMGVSGNEIFMNEGDAGVQKCVELIKAAYEEKIGQ